MNYLTSIDEIIAKLTPAIGANAVVERMPELEGDMKKLTDQSRIYVAFSKSEWAEPDTLGLVTQEGTLQFNVIVRSRRLYDSSTGIYALLHAAHGALIGFRPSNCLYKLQLMREELDQLDAQEWLYISTYKTKILGLEQPTAAPAPHILQQVIVNNPTHC